MTVNEILNINHCDVIPVMNGETIAGYRINSHEGWYIHLNNGVEDTVNVWKTSVILPASYDFSIVEIRAAADLPEGAEICGGTTPEPEVM